MLLTLFMLIDGFRIVGGQALNGFFDMKVPTLIAALTYWIISFPLGVWLGFSMDLDVLGFWIGLTVGSVIIACSYLIRFRWLARVHCLLAAHNYTVGIDR